MCVGWRRDPGSLLDLWSKFLPVTAVSVHTPALPLRLLYKFLVVASSGAAHLGLERVTSGQGQLTVNVRRALCVLDEAGVQGVQGHQANSLSFAATSLPGRSRC